MSGITFDDAKRRSWLRSIQFRWLFRTLELTLNSAPFDVLTALLNPHKGNLKVTAKPGAVPLPYEVLLGALSKLKEDYKSLEDEDFNAPPRGRSPSVTCGSRKTTSPRPARA